MKIAYWVLGIIGVNVLLWGVDAVFTVPSPTSVVAPSIEGTGSKPRSSVPAVARNVRAKPLAVSLAPWPPARDGESAYYEILDDVPGEDEEHWDSNSLEEAAVDNPDLLDLVYDEWAMRRRLELDDLEWVFQSESVDAQWSEPTLAMINESLADPALADIVLYDLDCRLTLCRLEVEYADALAEDVFVQDVLAEIGTRFSRIKFDQTASSDGWTYSIIYLGRKGFDFDLLR